MAGGAVGRGTRGGTGPAAALQPGQPRGTRPAVDSGYSVEAGPRHGQGAVFIRVAGGFPLGLRPPGGGPQATANRGASSAAFRLSGAGEPGIGWRFQGDADNRSQRWRQDRGLEDSGFAGVDGPVRVARTRGPGRASPLRRRVRGYRRPAEHRAGSVDIQLPYLKSTRHYWRDHRPVPHPCGRVGDQHGPRRGIGPGPGDLVALPESWASARGNDPSSGCGAFCSRDSGDDQRQR